MGNVALQDSLRQALTQDASETALRAILFIFGFLAALAWARHRPFLALVAATSGGLLGLGYWLVQIVSPLGFGTDPVASVEWAQAGVSAAAQPRGSGFVWGTEPEASLVSALALAGVPFPLVVLVPQITALLTLGLLTAVPFGVIRNRRTAALAACLALGGGLAPGVAPYGAILLRPSALLAASVLAAILVAVARGRRTGIAFRRARWKVSALFIAIAVLDRAIEGGGGPAAGAGFLMSGAAIVMTPLLRTVLRLVLASPTRTRSAEALLLLCAYCGSGLFWWDPPSSVPGFTEARDQNVALLRPMSWIGKNVPAGSVVLASPAYSAPIAAFGGRRVLFPPSTGGAGEAQLSEPFRRARLDETTRRGQPFARLAEAFSVTHLFLGPGEPGPSAGLEMPPGGQAQLVLVLEYQDAKDFRIFRLMKK